VCGSYLDAKHKSQPEERGYPKLGLVYSWGQEGAGGSAK